MNNNLSLFCSFYLLIYIIIDFILLRKYKKQIKSLEAENRALKKKSSIDIEL